MPVRTQIATYLPKRSTESASALEAVHQAAHPLTPAQLAQLSRALQLLEGTNARPGVITTVQDEMVSNLQSFLALVAAEEGQRLVQGRNGTFEAQFDEHDIIGWGASFFTWWRRFDKFDWHTPGDPEPIGDTFRMAVLADWGTGLYGAPVCAQSIAKDGKYQLLLHLGDVYYSGLESEYKARFTDLWPNVPGAVSRALNGNHEMYTGGNAYASAFKKLGQQASYFAFQNTNWILACLDSAFEDHDLHGDQAAWLKALAAASPEKRLVLFSHHQPFSLLDSQGPKLVKQLEDLLSSKRIHAWYWGHEHHCVLYEPHPVWGLSGRCVGHSGYPYFRDTGILGDTPPPKAAWRNLQGRNLVPGARMLDGSNPYIDPHGEDYGPNGYVTLEFDGREMFEIVHEPDGNVVWNQPVGEPES